MNNPLRYQISEYDCGPTSLLNALSYLFPREDIPPEVIRNVMLYCLDCYSPEGVAGKRGTSTAAMMFLSNWLNGFGQMGLLPVSSRYLTGRSVYVGEHSEVNDCLRRGGAAVVRLFCEEEHYVLFTGESDENIRLFDPYFEEEEPEQPDIQCVIEPCAYNRIVPSHYFNQESEEIYSLGPLDKREAVLLFNEETKLTEDKTIEYFI